ncbi:MAG: pyrimidine/purine nucleosidase domain-containing protein, partial [Rhodanobacteraceae bacterium]
MDDSAQQTVSRRAAVNAQIVPAGTLDVLSRNEIARLRDATSSGLHALLRSCALAVLTSGAVNDSARDMLDRYPDFDIQVLQQDRGVKLDLRNAPEQALVDGKIIRGTNELLFAVVRDIVYVADSREEGRFDLSSSDGITHAVFDILRNARVLRARFDPDLGVCWGGHSIPREEYEYSKAVGYQLGLRGMDICT